MEIGEYLDAIVSPQVDGGRGAYNKLSEGVRLKSWL
jgi:hypothetical protein